jgi:hypothetical protein
VIKISSRNNSKPEFNIPGKQSKVQPQEVLNKGLINQSMELKQDPTIKPEPESDMELKL